MNIGRIAILAVVALAIGLVSMAGALGVQRAEAQSRFYVFEPSIEPGIYQAGDDVRMEVHLSPRLRVPDEVGEDMSDAHWVGIDFDNLGIHSYRDFHLSAIEDSEYQEERLLGNGNVQIIVHQTTKLTFEYTVTTDDNPVKMVQNGILLGEGGRGSDGVSDPRLALCAAHNSNLCMDVDKINYDYAEHFFRGVQIDGDGLPEIYIHDSDYNGESVIIFNLDGHRLSSNIDARDVMGGTPPYRFSVRRCFDGDSHLPDGINVEFVVDEVNDGNQIVFTADPDVERCDASHWIVVTDANGQTDKTPLHIRTLRRIEMTGFAFNTPPGGVYEEGDDVCVTVGYNQNVAVREYLPGDGDSYEYRRRHLIQLSANPDMFLDRFVDSRHDELTVCGTVPRGVHMPDGIQFDLPGISENFETALLRADSFLHIRRAAQTDKFRGRDIGFASSYDVEDEIERIAHLTRIDASSRADLAFPTEEETFTLMTEVSYEGDSAQTLPRATGGFGDVTYTVNPPLPEGFRLVQPATRAGSPTFAGTRTGLSLASSHTLTATDLNGDAATATFSITIKGAPQFTSDQTRFVLYRGEVLQLPTAFGTGAITYALAADERRAGECPSPKGEAPHPAPTFGVTNAQATASGSETSEDYMPYTLTATNAGGSTTLDICISQAPSLTAYSAAVVSSPGEDNVYGAEETLTVRMNFRYGGDALTVAPAVDTANPPSLSVGIGQKTLSLAYAGTGVGYVDFGAPIPAAGDSYYLPDGRAVSIGSLTNADSISLAATKDAPRRALLPFRANEMNRGGGLTLRGASIDNSTADRITWPTNNHAFYPERKTLYLDVGYFDIDRPRHPSGKVTYTLAREHTTRMDVRNEWFRYDSDLHRIVWTGPRTFVDRPYPLVKMAVTAVDEKGNNTVWELDFVVQSRMIPQSVEIVEGPPASTDGADVYAVASPGNGAWHDREDLIRFRVDYNFPVKGIPCDFTKLPQLKIHVGANERRATLDPLQISGPDFRCNSEATIQHMDFRYIVTSDDQDLDGVSVGDQPLINGDVISGVGPDGTRYPLTIFQSDAYVLADDGDHRVDGNGSAPTFGAVSTDVYKIYRGELPYTGFPKATSHLGAVTYSLGAGSSLPNGLTLNADTGAVEGRVGATMRESDSVTLVATDIRGKTSSATMTYQTLESIRASDVRITNASALSGVTVDGVLHVEQGRTMLIETRFPRDITVPHPLPLDAKPIQLLLNVGGKERQARLTTQAEGHDTFSEARKTREGGKLTFAYTIADDDDGLITARAFSGEETIQFKDGSGSVGTVIGYTVKSGSQDIKTYSAAPPSWTAHDTAFAVSLTRGGKQSATLPSATNGYGALTYALYAADGVSAATLPSGIAFDADELTLSGSHPNLITTPVAFRLKAADMLGRASSNGKLIHLKVEERPAITVAEIHENAERQPMRSGSVTTSSLAAAGSGFKVGDRYYKAGDQIEFHLSFYRAVQYTAPENGEAPHLLIGVGENVRKATLVSPSEGATTLYAFRYTVQASDEDFDGVSLSENALRNAEGRFAFPNGGLAQTYTSLEVALGAESKVFDGYGVRNSRRAGDATLDADGDNLIDVSTPAQLSAMRYDLNGDGKPDSESDADAYYAAFADVRTLVIDGTNGCANGACAGYELVADLNMARFGKFEPIGLNFTSAWNGVFDGNGRRVTNVHIARVGNQDNIGLFGYAGPSSVIRNLGMYRVKLEGIHNIGAITGWNEGSVKNVYAQRVDIKGEGHLGLLAGYNWGGTIDTALASGSIVSKYPGCNGSAVGVLQGGKLSNGYTRSNLGTGDGNYVLGYLIVAGCSYGGEIEKFWEQENASASNPNKHLVRSDSELTEATDTWGTDAWDYGDSCEYPALRSGGHYEQTQRIGEAACLSP